MLDLNQIRRLVDIGVAACHEGKVADARIVFRGVLAARANFAPAWLGLALSYLVVDDFAEAAAILESKALTVDPHDPDAMALLGLSHMLAGRPQEARDLFLALTARSGPAGNLAEHCLPLVS